MSHLKIVKNITKENIQTAQQRQKQQYDKKSKEPPNFRVGQSVLLHSTKVPVGLSPKLHNPWIGPFYITNIGPNNTYKLPKCSNHKELKSPVHANRMMSTDQRLIQHHPNNHQHLHRPNQHQPPPPQTSQVHRPQNKDTTLEPNYPDDQYYVEKLLRYQSRDGKKFFCVKWHGHSERAWEPEEKSQIMV